MKTVKKAKKSATPGGRSVAGQSAAGIFIAYANKVAASKEHSLKLAKKAKIVTKTGQLAAHYR